MDQIYITRVCWNGADNSGGASFHHSPKWNKKVGEFGRPQQQSSGSWLRLSGSSRLL